MDEMKTQHRDALRTQLGSEAVRWDDDTLAQHRRDTWCMSILRDMRGALQAQPLCVVSPASTAEVAATLQYANALSLIHI